MSKLFNNFYLSVLIISLIFFITISLLLLDKYIYPWEDEMWFAATAKSFAEEGLIKNDVILGQEKAVYWQPPAYFVLLGIFIKLFGFGLEQVRIFSIIISSLFICIVYFLSRKLYSHKYSVILTLLIIILDPLFIRFSKIGRMDVLTLLFIFLSFVFYINWLQEKKKKHFILSSLVSMIAVTAHPLGLIAVLSIIVHHHILPGRFHKKIQSSLIFLIPILFLFLISLIFISKYPDSFTEQIQYQFSRKGSNILNSVSNFINRYRYIPFVFVLIVLSFISTILILIQKLFKTKYGVLVIGFWFSILICLFSYELFYSLYLLTFTALLLPFLFENIQSKIIYIYKVVILIWAVNVLVVNGYFFYLYLIKYKNQAHLKNISKPLFQDITKNSTVVVDGYPNLYWNLCWRKDIKIISPVLFSEKHEQKFVKDADYYLFASSFRISEDNKYTEKRVNEIKNIFEKYGIKLNYIKSYGYNIDYLYRVSLYKITKE